NAKAHRQTGSRSTPDRESHDFWRRPRPPDRRQIRARDDSAERGGELDGDWRSHCDSISRRGDRALLDFAAIRAPDEAEIALDPRRFRLRVGRRDFLEDV